MLARASIPLQPRADPGNASGPASLRCGVNSPRIDVASAGMMHILAARTTAPPRAPMMDRVDILLIGAAGYIAILSLVRLMAARRDDVIRQIREELARRRAAADAAAAAEEDEDRREAA